MLGIMCKKGIIEMLELLIRCMWLGKNLGERDCYYFKRIEIKYIFEFWMYCVFELCVKSFNIGNYRL